MIDRKVYFPENDIMAQSGTITDILQNIPSITLEAEGDILMRGSPNITFLLNGKPSGLFQQNSSVVLEQIPAHMIERIEIITNPSAKYKPDGTAGIINIITKKNMLPGIHGSIMANASTNQRYNGNISFNYNPGKVNISALYGYWQSYNPRIHTDQRIIGDSTTGAITNFDLKSESIGKPKSHTATFGIDYNPDDHNSFGLSMNYHGSEARRNDEVATIESNSSGWLRDYSTIRSDTDSESELELGISAEHLFPKEDHTISLEAEYGRINEKENSRFTDIYTVPNYPSYDGRNIIHKKEKATILSIDYTNPLSEDFELEAGYEGEYSTGDLDYFVEYFDQAQWRWQTDGLKTNKFLYQRDIHGFYATLARSFDQLGILVGLRAEQT
ncbi:MAG: outer membrane beta-barrel protein, partial [Saprospiraceae bacterium]